MRFAIGLVFILVISRGTGYGQELGVGFTIGYGIPGDSRSFRGRGPVNDWDPMLAHSGSSGHINFDRTQAGVVFGGSLFFREDPIDVGLGAFNFHRERVSGALLSTEARTANRNAVEFERVYRTVLLFIRYRYLPDSQVVPYLGAGVGIYGLWEKPAEGNSIREFGPVFQGVAGFGAEIAESFPEVFAELRLNIAELNHDPHPGQMGIATMSIAIGLRFAY